MARDEVKQLRTNLDSVLMESNSYKREKHELEIQILQLKKEMEKIHNCLMNHAEQFTNEPIDHFLINLKNVNSEDGLITKTTSISDDKTTKIHEIEEYVLHGSLDDKDKNYPDDINDQEYLNQKVKVLQIKLDDAEKTINNEKE